MKRISILFTLLLTILSVAGCGREQPAPEPKTSTAPEATGISRNG